MLRLSPWAGARITERDRAAVEARAREMGVTVGAIYSNRHSWWAVTAKGYGRQVSLKAAGPLAAALHGVLDDFEEAVA